ncbi:hypothetical protein QVD17_31955 [Tagetes erecta]|uniref:60S ribosomal protein L27a n=1 Tax=Tagetes erecta TaxID=13708 RepID=A0AAD8K4R3_TARER|nr:hypothetical protein QVD17_31955 [Tagetes erecta]
MRVCHTSYCLQFCLYPLKLWNKFYCPIVNVDKLWSLVPQDVKEKSSADKVPVIANQPIVVKAKLILKIAEKKIKEAGGDVVPTA